MKSDTSPKDTSSGLPPSQSYGATSRPPSPQRGEGGWRRRLGMWLFVGAVVLVGVRGVWGWASYPHKAERVARELGALSVIQKPPVVSQDGSRLGLIHTTDRGVGVFVADVTGKSEQKVMEVRDSEYDVGSAFVFGWSPDEETFVFAMTNAIHFWRRGNLSVFPFQVGIKSFGIRSFAWLNSGQGLYLNNGGRLRMLKPSGFDWEEVKAWDLPKTNGEVRAVLPISNSVVALHADTAVFWMDVSTEAMKQVYEEKAARITSLDYSPVSGALLITQTRTLTNKQTVAELIALPVSGDGNPGTATKLTEGTSILEARWVNGGKGYAYRTIKGGVAQLLVKGEMETPARQIFSQGEVYNFVTARSGGLVFAQASFTNEPPGIWRCEAVSGKTDTAWSPLGERSAKVAFQKVLSGGATYGNRHYAAFDLVPPANFSRTRKYPLVIGTGGYEWTPIAHGISAQALAQGGAYVALVNYRWNQSQIETVLGHTNNVLAVYDLLIANPNVDKDRVFLFGFSAATLVEKALLEMYPERWRGVMFFNPSELPTPGLELRTRVLATAGEAESGADKRFAKLHDDLCKVGIPMTWHIHPDGRHIVRAKEALRDRALLTLEFVFEK